MPTIFPQFYPPHNISPLAARFILKQGNVDGTRMATIALVSLISKGLSQVQRKSRERVSGQCNSGRIGTIRVLPFGDFIGRGCIITFACLSIWGIESIGLLFANFTFYIPNLKNFTQSACKNMSVLLSLKIYIKVAEIQSLLDEPEPTAKNFSDIYPYAFAVGLNTVWADKFAGQPAILQISKTEELSWYGGGETSLLNIYFENHLSSFENRSSATEKYSPPSESASGDGGGW